MKKLFSLLALAPLWLSAQVPQIGSSVQFKDTRTSTNTALAWLDTNKPTRTSGAVDPTANCSKADLYVQTATRHLWVCFGATSADWLDIGFVGGSASFASLVGDPTDSTLLGAVLNSKADLSALNAHTGNVSNPHSTTKTQVGLANVTNALQLQAALNLSDLNNLITARSNLGLGGSATLNVGTAAGTVAAGDHLHTSTYAALSHGHAASDITSGLLGIARIAGSGTCDSTTVVYGDQVCRTPPGSSGGEANTVSNQGSSGVGIFKSKLGVDLGFYKLAPASTKLSIALSGTDHIDLDVVEANIVHQNISGAGTNTHAQIDTHLAATNNPHGTTASQVSAPALTVMTTLGDLPYRDGSTWVRLAGNTVASKRFLCQTGTGSISAAPSWCSVVAGDVPTLNQNTTGSAASLSAASALPNGTTATTQTQADNSTKVASTAYVDTGLATRASSTASTTVNGTSCVLGSTCTVADSTKQPTSTKDTNGGYVGRDSSGNASIPGIFTSTGGFSSGSGSAASMAGAEQTPPTVTVPTLFFDSVKHLPVYLSAASAYVAGMVVGIADPGSDGNCVKYVNTSGVQVRVTCGAGGTSVNVNGSSVSSPNFNGTTPAAESGYRAVKFQVSSSSVSAEVPPLVPTDLPGEYYALSTGSANAYVVAPTTAVTAYVTGEKYFFKASFANTGAATVAYSGLSAVTIKKPQSAITTDLAANDIRNGQMVAMMFDGTNMQMYSQLGNAPSVSVTYGTTAGTATEGNDARLVAVGKTPMATDTLVVAGQLGSFNIRTSCFNLGTDNASADLVDADIGPQGNVFKIPAAATIIEATVSGNAGTPKMPILQKNHWGGSSWSTTDITSAALVTGAAGIETCAATGAACLSGVAKDGTVTIVTAGSANVVAAGDWIQTKTGSGFASSGAKRLSICVTYTVN